jgi:hypothetical protein
MTVTPDRHSDLYVPPDSELKDLEEVPNPLDKSPAPKSIFTVSQLSLTKKLERRLANPILQPRETPGADEPAQRGSSTRLIQPNH